MLEIRGWRLEITFKGITNLCNRKNHRNLMMTYLIQIILFPAPIFSLYPVIGIAKNKRYLCARFGDVARFVILIHEPIY